MRESAENKGRRYLTEGRLTVLGVDEQHVLATCRGAGANYRLGWDRARGWFCNCAARGRCAHLWALMFVTTREAVA